MKRWFILSIIFALICNCSVAQEKKDAKKDAKKEISRPPGPVCWEITDKELGVEYTIIPLDCVDPEVHERCRKLVKEDKGEGYMFFLVFIDNKKGKEPVKFSAYGGDAHFYYTPPKKNEKDKTEKTPEARKYPLISLVNYFKEERSVADKVGYKRIQEMLKTDLTVAPGACGWSLACIHDGFVYDVKGPRPNVVTWSIPGSETGMAPMKLKKYNKSMLKKTDVEFFKD
ncbi:MAG: hypothetical protein AB1696_06055 [Planctomycetota bacterium]